MLFRRCVLLTRHAIDLCGYSVAVLFQAWCISPSLLPISPPPLYPYLLSSPISLLSHHLSPAKMHNMWHAVAINVNIPYKHHSSSSFSSPTSLLSHPTPFPFSLSLPTIPPYPSLPPSLLPHMHYERKKADNTFWYAFLFMYLLLI